MTAMIPICKMTSDRGREKLSALQRAGRWHIAISIDDRPDMVSKESWDSLVGLLRYLLGKVYANPWKHPEMDVAVRRMLRELGSV